MRIGIIGAGAIGKYVRDRAIERDYVIRAILLRTERLTDHSQVPGGPVHVDNVADLPDDINIALLVMPSDIVSLSDRSARQH